MRLRARRPGLFVAAPLGLAAGLAVGLAALLLLRTRGSTADAAIAPCVPSRPCLALVIDDIGRDLASLEALLALPDELTFAVLPHAVHSHESRQAVIARGRELILHLPMDPLDRQNITDEAVIVGRDATPAEATRRCLRQVPEAAGVNNHMGSAFTQDPTGLAEVVRELAAPRRGRRLFVLDSRTSEHSLLCQAAREQGLACLERDVFLDDPPARPALTSGWERVVAAARQRGWAVAIAHPYPLTIEILRELLARREVRVVKLSRLLRPTGLDLTGQAFGI